MAKAPKLDRHKIKAQLDGLIADARHYDDGDRKGRRERALDYQAGRMPDMVDEEGKSQVVETVLADTMGQLQPSLMRVFLSSDKVAIFEPVPPTYVKGMPKAEFDAECKRVDDFAEQATDYLNFVFLKECNGEKLIRDVIYDGLLHGNGIIKHWWDATPKHETESYTGLTDDEYLELVADDDVEVLEHSEREAEGVEVGTVAGDDEAARLAAEPANGPGLGNNGGPGPQAGAPPLGMPQQAPPPGAMASGPMGAGPVMGAGGNAPPLQGMVGGAAPAAEQMAAGFGGPNGAEAAGLTNVGGLDLAGLLAPFAGIGGNFPPPPLLHDVKIRRVVSKGRLRVKALAGEDFLIESAATALNEDECRFCAHRDTPTRSGLVERGYDMDVVWALPSITENTEDQVRRERNWGGSDEYEDKAGERVEIFECYALLDPDEDGMADWYQVVVGGNGGSSEILELSEWGGRFPFSDVVPDPVPHRWEGRSLYDRLRDPQRVATAFSRRMNDNLYLTVEPQRAVNMSMIENPDALFDVQLGSHIRIKGDPRQAIMDLTVPFVAKEAQPLIEEQRRIAERRTGVGEQSSGLDADALTGQVATAVTATQSASGLRKEDYARSIAHGLRRAFSCMLRLMVENQDRERMIRLRKQWVPMNPQAWSAEMDVTINVGLGAGNRDRDLAMLQGIAGKQEMIMQVLGPDNPLCGVKEYFTTLQMMVEAAGVKGPERFFPDVSDDIVAQMKAAAQQKQQAPDPKLMAEQAKLQIAQQKAMMDGQIAQANAQSDQQMAQMKAQADAQLSAAKMQQQAALADAKMQADMRVREADAQHRMDLDRAKAQLALETLQLKAQAEASLAQAKADAQLQIERVKAEAQMQLKTQELAMEFQLKREQAAAGLNRGDNLEFPA